MQELPLKKLAHTQEIQHTTGVAPLVVVPCNELDEVLVERDTGGRIKDAGVVVSVQVSGDKSILGVGHDACHVSARNTKSQ